MSRDNLIVPILNVTDHITVNEEIEKTKTPQILIAKKPPASTSGITSFLDLPEGVVPDVEEATNIELNFPDVDDSAALDVDDEFSYSNEANFGTLKPAREGPSPPPKEEITVQESSSAEDSPLNNTVICNPNAGEQSTDVESKTKATTA